MFRNLFGHDSPLMLTMSKITDVIFLSIFWVICSIPVITLGASTAALYDATYRVFRQGERNGWQRFFAVFKSNWKGGIVPSIVFAVVFALAAKGTIALWNGAVGAALSWTAFAAGAFVAVVVLGILSVMFPMMSRFDNGLGALLRNTLLLGLAHLPRTVGLGIVNAAALLLCLKTVLPLFVVPALVALLSTVFLEPMFRPYMADNENEEENAAE